MTHGTFVARHSCVTKVSYVIGLTIELGRRTVQDGVNSFTVQGASYNDDENAMNRQKADTGSNSK